MKYYKSLIFFFSLSLNTAFGISDCDEKKSIEPRINFSSIDLLYGDLAPIIRSTIKQTVDEYKKTNKTPQPQNAYIIAEVPGQKSPIVFGLTEKQVLEMDGDPNGSACSGAHIRNDFSNRWCHAFIVKLAYETAKLNGVANIAAAMLGASIFVVKEYAIDLHPSKSDLVIADYMIYKSKNNSESITGTVFGDGMIFINYQKKF